MKHFFGLITIVAILIPVFSIIATIEDRLVPDAMVIGLSDATPSAGLSPETNPRPSLTVSGIVTNASGSDLIGNLTATLVFFDTVEGRIYDTQTANVAIDGSYLFLDLTPNSQTAFWVLIEYLDVSYYSDYVVVDDATTTLDLPVVVYNSSTDWQKLEINLVHIILDATTDVLTISEYYVISNESLTTVILETDGSYLPFIELPSGFTKFDSLAPDTSSASFLPATDGIALPPQPESQYGVMATMSVPYKNRLKFVQNFSAPIVKLNLIVPKGIRIKTDQLIDMGENVKDGATYHLYTLSNMLPGELAFTVYGTQEDSTSFVLYNRSWIIIAIGVLGGIFIILGFYLFFRDNARKNQEELFDKFGNGDDLEALGDNPDEIADAIIQLDDDYARGDMSKDEYEKRRVELKAKLRELLM